MSRFGPLLEKASGWLPVLLEFHRGDENVSWHWVKSLDELSTLLENGPRAEPGEKPYVATIYPFTPAYEGILDEKMFREALTWGSRLMDAGEIPFVVETESQWGYSGESQAEYRETLDYFRGRPVVIGPEPDLTGDSGYTAKLA